MKLLLLTGCRLSELSESSWVEYDLDKAELVVPPQRNKIKTGFVVPLSSLAMEIIGELPRFGGGYVFTTTKGDCPFSGSVAPKRKLDELSGVSGLRFMILDVLSGRYYLHSGLTIRWPIASSAIPFRAQRGSITATNIIWNVAKRWKL